MKYHQNSLLLILFLLLLACTPEIEPIAVTRLVITAVATATPSPIITPSPTSTLTTIVAAATATQTAVVPTATPTATTTTAVPTVTPAVPLSEFLVTLQAAINARDFDTLRTMTTQRFVLRTYPIDKNNPATTAPVGGLNSSYIPYFEAAIAIGEENILSQVTAEPFIPQTLFGEEQAITAVVHSTGWGSAGNMPALLYITVEDGHYLWAGLVASPDNFAVLPDLPMMTAPPGLVYELKHQWWRVTATGATQLLPTVTGALSLNPSGTLALSAESGRHRLSLFTLPEGEEAIISLEGTLLHGSDHMPWLDDETAVLLLGPFDEQVSQGTIGNLTLLHIPDGSLTTLPPQLSVYQYPAITADGGILYTSAMGNYYAIHLWRDGTDRVLDIDHSLLVGGDVQQIDGIGGPIMSPDGHYVAGASGVTYGRYRSAYVLADLVNHTTTFLYPFIHLPTDASLPLGIHWSPDGQWLALDPPVWMLDANVQLVSINNLGHLLPLGAGTSRPLWLDSQHLVFRSVNYDDVRWQYLDLDTDEQFWLDLPAGAEVMAYVSSN